MPTCRLPLLIALCVSATALAGGAIESTFDTDAEGWTTFNDTQDFMWTDEFTETGGAIRASDVNNTWWYFDAPDEYRGDKSSYFGAELAWDLYGIEGDHNAPPIGDVMLVGNGVVIGALLNVRPENGEWSSHSVRLDLSSDWRKPHPTIFGLVTSEPATVEDMQTVLANLEGLYIRGEFTNGFDSVAMDNVRLVPPPCGDVNGDGQVDLNDLNVVLSTFGTDNPDGDATNDGTVDLADLNVVLSQFGGGC